MQESGGAVAGRCGPLDCRCPWGNAPECTWFGDQAPLPSEVRTYLSRHRGNAIPIARPTSAPASAPAAVPATTYANERRSMAAPTENTAAEGMPPTNAPMIVPPFAAFPRTQTLDTLAAWRTKPHDLSCLQLSGCTVEGDLGCKRGGKEKQERNDRGAQADDDDLLDGFSGNVAGASYLSLEQTWRDDRARATSADAAWCAGENDIRGRLLTWHDAGPRGRAQRHRSRDPRLQPRIRLRSRR
jgi:hypothetical protein